MHPAGFSCQHMQAAAISLLEEEDIGASTALNAMRRWIPSTLVIGGIHEDRLEFPSKH